MKKKVRQLSRILKLSPDELAERLGVRPRVVLNWMTGRVKESSKSVVIDNALNALEEGFEADFVVDHLLTDRPLSLRRILQKSRISEKAEPRTPPEWRDPPGGKAEISSSVGEEREDHVLGDMEKASRDAFDRGHYIQSALILFQAIEALLRIVINTQGRQRGIADNVLREAADKEQSFLRLTLHLDLVYPDNELSDDLRHLNRRRNDTMHRLFYEYESRREMEEKMHEFCLEARELRDRLADEVQEYLKNLLST